jgi:hypothetical protein
MKRSSLGSSRRRAQRVVLLFPQVDQEASLARIVAEPFGSAPLTSGAAR